MAMQEIVEQILEGKYDYENSSLDFSCAKLEHTMRSGEVLEGSFHVYSSADVYTHGIVSVTDMRMECLTPEFVGSGEEIFYCFHGEHLEEGDVVKGNFCIVSNLGEYYLPFVVTVEHQTPASTVGNVKNLFHFANLAKSSWQEAVELFYSPEFARVFSGSDRQFYDCYRGLSACPGNERNMEEFLICISKKQKTEFLVSEREIYREFPTAAYGAAEEEIVITRNGWGCTALRVECEGDFLFAQKEFLGETDFLGNRCALPFFIDTQLCRPGRNFGRISLRDPYTSIDIPVTVHMGEASSARDDRLRRKRLIAELMKCYEDFRLKKIGAAAWMEETGRLADSLAEQDEDDLGVSLFRAQLLISGDKCNEAVWILKQAEETFDNMGVESDTLYAYYLYLTTLIRREEAYVNEVAGRVEQLYERDRSNWRIGWLLLYLSEEYNRTAAFKWNFLEKQFYLGCSSPILYIEALNLLNSNPTLLRRLDEFALQVMYFGAGRDGLNPEILDQLLYLCGKGKNGSPTLLKLLQRMYAKFGDARTLQEICTLLVRANRVGPKYSEWYEAGVREQLRITNLYEYYIMSLDMEKAQELPRTALIYFSYQNNLDLAHSAFLYWYVVRHKYELGELYDSYRPRVERFVIEQIQKGRVSRHLAGLYKEFLSPAMINDQTALPLSRILFAHRVSVADPRMKKVIVYQPGNLQEKVYPLQDKSAWLPLYGNDSTILFEDDCGGRFVKSVEYTLEKLMIPGRFLRMISGAVTDSRELDLYIDENERETENMSQETRERKRRLAEDEQVEVHIRRRCWISLMRHYYDTDDMQALDDCLENAPMEMFSLKERAEALRFMALRDRLDTAWEWVTEFGPAFAEPKVLARLVSGRIRQTEGEEDDLLAQAAMAAFRHGRYDSQIVSYLAEYARCSTRELRDIWRAMRSFGLDAHALERRLLVQMMFSGVFVGEKKEIFESYLAQGADPEIEEAFLTRCSYDYFAKERLTDEIVFDEIRSIYLNRGEIPRVCRLAFLKYYAENPSAIDQELAKVIGIFLREVLAEKIHLNFFRSYMDHPLIQEPLLRELFDKTIVEYRCSPGAKASIHYVITREDGEASEYLTEPMREVCGGVCFKEFVLFFGESLQYYIMEEKDGEEQLTESSNLQKGDITGDGADWRYAMLNDILISRTLEDYDTLDDLLDEYRRREYLGEHLFALQ